MREKRGGEGGKIRDTKRERGERREGQRAVVERTWKRKKVVGDDNGIPRNVISIASVIDQATRSEYGN